MVLDEATKQVLEETAFLCLVTIGEDGAAHPIVTGKAQVQQDAVVFGIYKMEATQKNLAANPNMWVVAATKDGGPAGFRLSGTGKIVEKQLVFTPSLVEKLL